MRTVAIIQARMGSTRLPGKVLMEVMGKPLLEYQLERVTRSHFLDDIIIATTTNEQDQAITDWCRKMSYPYFQGSEHDVLDRYFQAATLYDAQVVVRLTADCPVIDPQVIDRAICLYREHDFDYVSNTVNRTYPRGMDVEVFSYEVLKESHRKASSPAEREHVTPYIYRRPSIYKLGDVINESDQSKYRLTVDTKEDFELICRIIAKLYPTDPKFTLQHILQVFAEHPAWFNINAHVEQKSLGE